MYQLDEHEAYQAMACYLERHAHGDVGVVIADLLIEPNGFNFDGAVWLGWLECVRDVKAASAPGNLLAVAPAALIALNKKLIASEFVTVDEWDDETPIGRGLVEWRRGDTRVRALCHALDWSLWIACEPLAWFEPVVWMAHLTDAMPEFGWPPEIGETCGMADALIDRLPVTVADRSGVRTSLNDWRARYVSAVRVRIDAARAIRSVNGQVDE